MLSYQFSVFGQVNNFAVVVGLNSSVRVDGIREEEYVLLLTTLFRYETMAAESWVGSHQSMCDFDVSDCRSSILLSIM